MPNDKIEPIGICNCCIEAEKQIDQLTAEIDKMLHSYNSERLKNNQLTAKLNEYEGDDKRWHSFETVQAILKERDTLTAENERLKELTNYLLRFVKNEDIDVEYVTNLKDGDK